jgi:glycosyltransferase involved in cell wall biosynthesis
VAHILPYRNVGGTEISQLRSAEAARSLGLRNTVFCLPDAPLVQELFSRAGFETVPFDPVEPSYRHLRRFLGHSGELAREFSRREIDLVHSAEILGAYSLGYSPWMARIPLLCHVRNRFSEISLRDRSFLLPVSKFVFVSKDTWTRFGHPVSPGRGSVIYEAIDLKEPRAQSGGREAVRRELGIPDGAEVVGTVCRVAPQKDFPTLIRAAARVVATRPQVRFLVVGDHTTTSANRDYYREMVALIEECGVAEHFLFTGHRSDVDRMLSALDVFVLSSHWEGMPVVLLEAMADALPIVATAVDGVPELISDGQTGLLCAHEDPEQLAGHLLHLLERPDVARRMAVAARERVASHFSRERFTERIGAAYSSLLGRPVRREDGTALRGTPLTRPVTSQQS